MGSRSRTLIELAVVPAQDVAAPASDDRVRRSRRGFEFRKQVLRRLSQINPQYLMGFITKKKNPMGVPPRGVHPMLEKEAYDMVVKSGAVPRKIRST